MAQSRKGDDHTAAIFEIVGAYLTNIYTEVLLEEAEKSKVEGDRAQKYVKTVKTFIVGVRDRSHFNTLMKDLHMFYTRWRTATLDEFLGALCGCFVPAENFAVMTDADKHTVIDQVVTDVAGELSVFCVKPDILSDLLAKKLAVRKVQDATIAFLNMKRNKYMHEFMRVAAGARGTPVADNDVGDLHRKIEKLREKLQAARERAADLEEENTRLTDEMAQFKRRVITLLENVQRGAGASVPAPASAPAPAPASAPTYTVAMTPLYGSLSTPAPFQRTHGPSIPSNSVGGIEARLGGTEARLGGTEARLGGTEARLGGTEARLAVAPPPPPPPPLLTGQPDATSGKATVKRGKRTARFTAVPNVTTAFDAIIGTSDGGGEVDLGILG